MTDRPAAPPKGPHFTVAYTGASRGWAAWIGDQLGLQGHRVALVRWPLTPSVALEQSFRDLLRHAPDRLVVVLDDWLFAASEERPQDAEDVARLTEHAQAEAETASFFNVALQPPATALALQPVDLLNIDEGEARRRILLRLGLDADSAETRTAAGHRGAHRFPNDPPVVWQAPRRNGRFTGRDTLLEHLHARFTESLPGTARLALQGQSGVGKTQLADEYVHRYGNEYDVVWYVNASSRANVRKELAELGERLGVPTGPELGDAVRGVHERLRTGRPHRRWLLVLDEAEEPDQISPLVPQGDGHVLVTTRTGDWAQYGMELVPVDQFDRAESLAFVRRRAPRLKPYEAERLAEAAEDVPLLLDQTAGWLQQTPGLALHDYLRQLENDDSPVQPGEDYPRKFSQSWAITLNALYEENPALTDLLHLCAFFSPHAIPVRMLRAARPGDVPEHLGDILADQSSWNMALRRLGEAAAVRIEYGERPYQQDIMPVGTVRMHRLYQAFVRRNLDEADRERFSASACRVLATADPRDPTDPTNWVRYDSLIPHLEYAGALQSTEPEIQQLVLNCIEYLRTRGEHMTGLSVCKQVVESWRQVLPENDGRLLIAEHQHANMLRRLGRYSEAEKAGRAVVLRLESRPGTPPIDLLRARDGLAGTLMALGSYQEAAGLFAEEAKEAEHLLGDASVPRTLSARSNLGTALSLLGRYQEALDVHSHVLAARRRLHGERHQLTLYSTLKVAWTLRLLGRYDEAASVQALNARLHGQILDKLHAQTLQAEHNYALCLRRAGNLDFAEALMRHVVDSSCRRLGDSHPGALALTSDYAMLLRQRGDLDRARELADRTAVGFQELLGASHPFAAGTHGNRGLARWRRGEEAEAVGFARESLERMTDAVGAEHPWSIGCALNVVSAQQAAGDAAGSEPLARRAVGRAEEKLGGDHPLTMNCRLALARSLPPTQRDEAAALTQATVGHAARTYGENHAYTVALRQGVRPYWDFEPQPV